ncbi:hypothetical protein [Tuberibacillus sp. Marseille-P3662]|uniref:hypothetical protein n=1 Tax=Tuberibacillus sp. Marseille-P3662 TaxID=1965358 RepID=UPI000A1CAB5B|nr:hypothetical protein [Tuberibacillus sp. Marseille-P3662]
MAIVAELKPLPVTELTKDDPLYRELELSMQQLGHLTPYRETLNWDEVFDSVEIGEMPYLDMLKKAAAKNDGLPLFIAKLMKGRTVFEHIMTHPNNKDYYLPFHFEHPYQVNIKGNKIWIGSAPRLAEELKWLEMTIQNHSSDELKAFWSQLRYASQQSMKHMTPIHLQQS